MSSLSIVGTSFVQDYEISALSHRSCRIPQWGNEACTHRHSQALTGTHNSSQVLGMSGGWGIPFTVVAGGRGDFSVHVHVQLRSCDFVSQNCTRGMKPS
jgi:hypothetical protein